MNRYADNSITTLQFIAIITGTQVSFGFIDIPYELHEHAGSDGWISLVIGWLVTTAASLIAIRLMKGYRQGTLLDLLAQYGGRWAGRAVACVLACYFAIFSYDGLIYSTRVIKSRILQETPIFITLFLILIPAYMVARNEVRNIGRYSEFALLASLWIPFIFSFTLRHANWLYLLPVLPGGWGPVLSTVPHTIYYFLSFFASVFLYPYLQKKERAGMAIVIALTLTLLSFLFISIVCFVFLSPDEFGTIYQPAIYLLKTVRLPFLEQVEGMFIVMYLLIFSIAWIPSLYFFSYSVNWTFGRTDPRLPLRLLIGTIIVSSYFYVPDYWQLIRLNKWLSGFGFGVEYVLPLLLLALLSMSKRYRAEVKQA
jgi:spore germination protein (amino acid permease)